MKIKDSKLLNYYELKSTASGSQQQEEAKLLTSMYGLVQLADQLTASVATKRPFEPRRHCDPHKTMFVC